MKRLTKISLFIVGILFLIGIVLFKPVDRTPYSQLPLFEILNARLDSLQSNVVLTPQDSLFLGFSKISLTPQDTVPLAGYGARNPKEYTEILDSVFVRTLVLKNKHNKIAILSTELLLNHPDVVQIFYQKIKTLGWHPDEIFLGATHTHSGPGGWAKSLGGQIILGDFDSKNVHFVVNQMLKSLKKAQQNVHFTRWRFEKMGLKENITNRLIEGGDTDFWVRHLLFKHQNKHTLLTSYAAHATCFSSDSRKLTGDFPSYFYRYSQVIPQVANTLYLAGAVGSMGAYDLQKVGQQKAQALGKNLSKQVETLTQQQKEGVLETDLRSFHLTIPLRNPQLKISKNWCVRPWVFDAIFGKYDAQVSVLKIGNTLLLGMPADFSGEVALPLYEYAAQRNLNLMITSFNGGYIGYITQDEWYDMNAYEPRSMNWYGPNSDAYFSHLAKRIIDIFTL